MRNLSIIAALALGLAACGKPLPEVQTQIAKVPVQQPCHTAAKLGPEPDYSDTAAKLAAVPHPDAMARLKQNPADPQALLDQMENLGYQIKALLKGRADRIQRDKEKSAALAGCEGT